MRSFKLEDVGKIGSRENLLFERLNQTHHPRLEPQQPDRKIIFKCDEGYRFLRANPNSGEVDRVCEFRAREFYQAGVYTREIKSDRDEFDGLATTHLLYAQDAVGEIVGTLRLIGRRKEYPQLPIEKAYFLAGERGFVPFDEFAKLHERESDLLKKASSQISGLAANVADNKEKRARVMMGLFRAYAFASEESNLPDSIVCARPKFTSVYKGSGAEELIAGQFFLSGEIDSEALPVDILYLTREKVALALRMPMLRRFLHLRLSKVLDREMVSSLSNLEKEDAVSGHNPAICTPRV